MDEQALNSVESEQLLVSAGSEPAPFDEWEAFLAMRPMLLANYANMFVALADGRLVDSDPSYKALVTRLATNHPGKDFIVERINESAFEPRSPEALSW